MIKFKQEFKKLKKLIKKYYDDKNKKKTNNYDDTNIIDNHDDTNKIDDYIIKDIDFNYPESFKKLIELNLVDFDIWALLDTESATMRYYDLPSRYPKRNLIPFARRWDNDDIACFEIMKDNSIKVQLIHDFASQGWEQRKEFKDFWEWVETAIKNMIEYNKEDGIE